MKKYKLLKDLPFAKAGDIVEMWSDGIMTFIYDPTLPRINKKDVRMFPLWFEEVKELEIPDEFYIVEPMIAETRVIRKEDPETVEEYETKFKNYSDCGLAFLMSHEAVKYLAYLKAKAIIKQDAKGFKPNWRDKDEDRFMGCWDFKRKRALFDYGDAFKTPEIYFKSREDISESFKKHPEEWKTYLTYEQ